MQESLHSAIEHNTNLDMSVNITQSLFGAKRGGALKCKLKH